MYKLIFTILFAIVLTGCPTSPQSEKGFRLPDGEVARGRQAFIDLNCGACHAVFGDSEFVKRADADPVMLGGATTRVRTYGDLVTSIINPSHKIAPHTPQSAQLEDGTSAMEYAGLNNRMTVTELINLVAFLQDQYKVVPPQANPYRHIYP